MRRVRVFNGIVILIYACLVLFLALYLLVFDESVFFRLQQKLPLSFIARFGIFWFISFVLAILFFLLNLKLNYFRLEVSDRLYSLKIGKIVLTAGILGGLLLVIAFHYFRTM